MEGRRRGESPIGRPARPPSHDLRGERSRGQRARQRRTVTTDEARAIVVTLNAHQQQWRPPPPGRTGHTVTSGGSQPREGEEGHGKVASLPAHLPHSNPRREGWCRGCQQGVGAAAAGGKRSDGAATRGEEGEVAIIGEEASLETSSGKSGHVRGHRCGWRRGDCIHW